MGISRHTIIVNASKRRVNPLPALAHGTSTKRTPCSGQSILGTRASSSHRYWKKRPEKLVAYLGLNPGQCQSGHGKNIRLGIGRRGRSDMRHLLIQGAQAVLRMGKATPLGQWGWKLFARKGNRNTAVAAVARKLVVQVWHLLSGNAPTVLEENKSVALKLQKLIVILGKSMRAEMGLPVGLRECSLELQRRMLASYERVHQ